jgi:hypothetical protein
LGWNLGKKRAKKAAKRVRGWVSLKRDNIWWAVKEVGNR